MGKISQIASKYIIHAKIQIDGVVNRPDVVGAVFGQTEGLLGSELELRELQRSGRIGRIDVNVETKSGKTYGKISVPSSLDKSETALIAAAIEVIQRIGPCNSKVNIESIEDVRVSKRNFVIKRAKELLKRMVDDVMPDSTELSDEVTKSVRVMEIQEYGRDRLSAGPAIDESEEIIVVEGRADVLNLLKYGFKNAIAVNGTSVPKTIIDLSKKKEVTVFVDGDRGGKLIIQELFGVAQVDYVAFAPDGKEVEEITKKEIHQSLRGKIAAEQAKLEIFSKKSNFSKNKNKDSKYNNKKNYKKDNRQNRSHSNKRYNNKPKLSKEESENFSTLLNDLIGTRGAYILDEKLEILGKVPITELEKTMKSLDNAYAVVFDGEIKQGLVQVAEKSKIKYLVAMSSKVENSKTRINILVEGDF
jgi:DNA primase